MLLERNCKLLSNVILLLSLICLGSIIISIFGVRGNWFGIRAGFTAIGYLVQAGVLVLIAGLIVFYLSRNDKRSFIKSGFALILVLIPVVAHYATTQPEKKVPGAPLNDISTDTVNPPLFDAVASLRPAKSNSLKYPGVKAAKRQEELFPDITSIPSSLSRESAFKRALDIAETMNWDIVSQDVNTGIIEAVASTIAFDFKDDVVIRIQSATTGSLIDIRSHSRIGRSDRGKNAQRVREFITQFKQ
ncbi:DUF1499 domain-containing protein [Psychromonas arctica]|uniref:DUF1499 domain-containing protein n=1 Tax=Psychromonas arctica TaxID=168275 RepID=A0ABU9H760_9GAMM